ncbi:hypothetical protein AVEN_12765-1 [Araneus ventricosus]|uniref:Uncharacterized protein n=1 Tax=Araneus ventricosus TaxID=182803 RepID=A0A4Y2AB64_ARAVE|nr:hypothetical protein AVEN_12765-1 [Araneus ventricosus]
MLLNAKHLIVKARNGRSLKTQSETYYAEVLEGGFGCCCCCCFLGGSCHLGDEFMSYHGWELKRRETEAQVMRIFSLEAQGLILVLVLVSVIFTSRFEATQGLLEDGPLNFEPRSVDEDATSPSPNFSMKLAGGHLS